MHGRRPFLVEHHDAGRDAGAVEQVCGQADEALDEAVADDAAADRGLGAAAEQHTVGQDHRALAGAVERGQHMQQKGVVAVLGRRQAEGEAAILVVGRVEAVGPGLGGKRRIGDHVVEGLEPAVLVREVWRGQRVVLPDLGGGAVVQDHVHACQRAGGVVHLLAVDRQVEPGARLGLVVRLQEQRTRSAGRVVDALGGTAGAAELDHHRNHPRDFGRGVELALALAGFGGEVAHQVFVGVAQQVVALGAVAAKVQPRVVEDGDQVRQPVDHLLALAQLVGVVEVGDVDHALEVVGFGHAADDLVEPVADLLVAACRDHVGEAAAWRHLDQRVAAPGVIVGDVFDEQQDQHVVLVLAGIHATPQLVTGFPEG